MELWEFESPSMYVFVPSSVVAERTASTRVESAPTYASVNVSVVESTPAAVTRATVFAAVIASVAFALTL